MFKLFKGKQWLEVFTLNTFSVVIRIVISILSSKLTAVYLGPSGVALLENLRNFISILDKTSTLGTENGVVNYLADKNSTSTFKSIIVSTVLFFLLSFCCVLTFVLAIYYYLKPQYIYSMLNNNLQFWVLLFSVPFYILNSLVIAIFKAYQKFKIAIITNTLGYVISIFLLYFFTLNLGLIGAFWSVILAPILLGIVNVYLFFNHFKTELKISCKHFDLKKITLFRSFALMALVSGILGPLVFLFIRDLITQNFSLEIAGIWSGLQRISNFYMIFFASVVTLYFYPKIVSLTTKIDSNKLIKEYYLGLIPLFTLGLLLLFILKTFFIKAFLSEDFLDINQYLYLQLFGDFCKALSMYLGYLLVANKKTTFYILGEILSYGSYCLLTIILINYQAITGVLYAFVLSNLLYLFYIIFVNYKINSPKF